MRLRDRTLSALLAAPFRAKNWRAAFYCIRTVHRPGAFLLRYLSNSGSYPHQVTIRTPVGPVRPMLFSRHDLLTVNEVFCRRDYGDGVGLATVVDVGANIGIATLWFLVRSPSCFVYCVEPDERNALRLEQNLAPFSGRFSLTRAAAGRKAGTGRFWREPSGRYGHLLADGSPAHPAESGGSAFAEVQVVAIDALLDEVLASRGSIDLLKVDTEGTEEDLIDAIPPQTRARVRRVFYELPGRVVDSAERPPGRDRWKALALGVIRRARRRL